MTAAATIIMAAALAAVAIGLALALYRARTVQAPVLSGRTVVVNTRRPDDQTIRGVLMGEYVDRLTLRDACYVHKGGETAVPGLVHVPTRNVAWMQELEPDKG